MTPVNPWELLGTATLPGGDVMTLSRRGDEYALRVANVELMNSRQSGSEESLATLAGARVPSLERAAVLVGGLGMGFTLRAALDALPADASVTVAELVPEVVAWNRSHLGGLAGEPLADPRVRVVVGDVADLVRGAEARYDLVLLDTDNGPEGTTHEDNEWLYSRAGVRALHTALRPGGVLAVWSVFPSDAFTKRLAGAGFDVDVEHVRSRGKKGHRHVIWLAQRRAGPARRGRRPRRQR